MQKLLLAFVFLLLFTFAIPLEKAYAVATVEYLVIGGGGGGGLTGGLGGNHFSAGGGAGGYRTATGHVVTSQAYTITVGAGGASNTNGNDSIFDTITSTGGGRGGGQPTAGGAGGAGGSGGGSYFGGAVGVGTAGQGNNGGLGSTSPQYGTGGGGGAGAVGAAGTTTVGGAGGAGLSSSISGSAITRAGGGGGSINSGTAGAGGSGGGGAGNVAGVGTAGTANTGGGGGGSSGDNIAGGAGGSGIVILRYLTGSFSATGGTITTDGAYTIHTFTTSGTFTVTGAESGPNAIDDLTSPAQTYGSVDLLWTLPVLNDGTCAGHQINYTTPWGNPLTVISNNTASCTTSATVSSLDIGTPYTFGVSVWTAGGNNATHPPMTWLNVTTLGNFTIGTATFNQTNTEVLPITFEEQSINSTATFLNVTYANTFSLACDFYYQFANNNRTYTGLTGYPVSSTLDETYFILTDFEDEIININCYDVTTGTDANYLMEQSTFPLLDQFANFRNGTYGTMGLFGVFDLITIAVVIFSMIGLNRVNESVGAVFNIILLGSLAYFEIIELPTIIFGVLTVVIIFVITSTKKD